MAPWTFEVPSNYGCLIPQVHHLVSFHFLSLWLPNLTAKKTPVGYHEKNPKKRTWSKGIWIYLEVGSLHNKTGVLKRISLLPFRFRLILPTLGRRLGQKDPIHVATNMEPENASPEKVKSSSKPIIFRFYVNLPGCKPWLFSGTKNGLESFLRKSRCCEAIFWAIQ